MINDSAFLIKGEVGKSLCYFTFEDRIRNAHVAQSYITVLYIVFQLPKKCERLRKEISLVPKLMQVNKNV